MKILLLSVVGATFLAAQQAPVPRHRFDRAGSTADPGHGLERVLTATLSLTAEQQNKVHTALSERDVQAKGSREQMKALNTSLAAAVKAGNDDQIEQISQQIATQHQKNVALHARTMVKVYAALSPAQQAKVGPNLEMLMGRGGFGGFGPGGPGRRGPGPRQNAPTTPPAAQ